MRFIFLSLTLLFFSETVSAQYYGRNKVQYTDFNWQVLKTAHFDIYYYSEMEDLAQIGAAYAEEAYSDLKDRFLHNLGSRVPLIFYSSPFHFEQTNTIDQNIGASVGGFFEFAKGRVVIPSDGNLNQFRHVIRHELVHVFTHSKYSRVMKDFRVPSNKFFPLWFTEGIAEFWSGDQGNYQTEMILRDATLEGYLVPLTEMNRIYGSYLMYREGENICKYISETYGDNTLLQLFENIRKTQNFEEVFKITLGKNFKEFEKDWIYSLQKKYFPLLIKEDTPSQISDVITAKGFNVKPIVVKNLTTQNNELYYVGNMTGYTSIYKIVLEKNEDDEYPTPKLVVEGEKTDDYESFKGFDSGLAFNSKGEMAFVTKSGENDVIHIYDLNNDSPKATYGFNEIVKIGNISWSSESNKITFSALDKGGYSDLYIFDLTTEQLLRLTRDRFDDLSPVWSPDNRFLIFSSDRISEGKTGSKGIFALDLKTYYITNLTNGNSEDLTGQFSEDQKTFLFTSTRSGSRNIWFMKWKDMLETITSKGLTPLTAGQLTHFTTASFDPYLSNNTLYFSAFENYSVKIRMIDNISNMITVPIETRQVNELVWSASNQWEPKRIDGTKEKNVFMYDKEYSMDIAQGQLSSDPLYGTLGGISLAFSDVLGNEKYFVTVYNNAESPSEIIGSFNIALSHLIRSERTNYSYGFFHLNGRRYDITDPDIYYYERLLGGFFSLSYPISSFNRLDASLMVAGSKKESLGYVDGLIPLGVDINQMYGQQLHRATLVSNTISFVHDNSLWAFTGPLDGSRYSISLGYTTDVENNEVNYFTIAADYRNYFRLSDRSTFAFRLLGRASEGDEARRSILVGSWDIRGYSNKIYETLRGKKVWIMNNEFRFPLLDNFGLRFPFFDFNLSMFRGAVFLDMGNAWDDYYSGTLGSYGYGIRYNLANAIVLRYDIGKKWSNSLGNASSGYFYQFFFGWDF